MNLVNQFDTSTAVLNDVYNVYRKMLIYDRMTKLIFEKCFVNSNVLAYELGLSNSEIIICAQEMNLTFPNYFDLEFLKSFGGLKLTSSGRNLLSAELREAAEDDGGIPMRTYKRLLTRGFIDAATRKEWIRTSRKGKVLLVYKGDRKLEFESACVNLRRFTNGLTLNEEMQMMLVDSDLLVPQWEIPVCRIKIGPNFPRRQPEMEALCLEVLRRMLYSVKLPRIADQPVYYSQPAFGPAFQAPVIISNPVLQNPMLSGSVPVRWVPLQVRSTPR